MEIFPFLVFETRSRLFACYAKNAMTLMQAILLINKPNKRIIFYKLLKKLSVEFLLFLAKTLWFTLIEYVCSENIPLKFKRLF